MSLLTNVLKLWRTGQYLLPADSGFSPKHLLAGRVGWWLDPLDFRYARQDGAGATAYTAVEQGVGMAVDKSANGLTFVQASAPAKPVVSARVNLLTKSGQFSVSPWIVLNITNTPGGASPTPDDYSHLALTSTANVEHYIEQSFTHPGNASYVASFIFKPSTSAIATIAPVTVGSTATVSESQHSISSGVVSNLLVNGIVSSQSSVYIGNDAYKISATYTTNGTVTSHRARLYPASSATLVSSPVAGIGTSVTGASVCFASRSNLPYQYVNTATDYDTAGFPHCLKFDGAATNLVGASGGGASTAFYFGAAVQFGKVGAVQTIVSDAGTNTGFKIRTTAANQIEISAGNGAAFTAVNTTETFAAGDVAFIELFDNGTNLSACLGNGTPATVARPAVSAGTAQMTLGKANNAASEYSGVSIFSAVYLKDYCPTAAERADYKRWALQRAGVAS